MYEGGWVNGQKHGEGCIKNTEDMKIIFKGSWDNGILANKSGALYIPIAEETIDKQDDSSVSDSNSFGLKKDDEEEEDVHYGQLQYPGLEYDNAIKYPRKSLLGGQMMLKDQSNSRRFI